MPEVDPNLPVPEVAVIYTYEFAGGDNVNVGDADSTLYVLSIYPEFQDDARFQIVSTGYDCNSDGRIEVELPLGAEITIKIVDNTTNTYKSFKFLVPDTVGEYALSYLNPEEVLIPL